MKIVYKCKSTGIVSDSVDLNSFDGYRIQFDYNKISKVTEMRYNEVLAKIDYRPTKIPIIQQIEYNGHLEERYNNNRISSLSYRFDGILNGEYIKYTITGTIMDRMYFYNGKNITTDVMNFIGYKDDVQEFKYYNFQEDEMFNLMAKYGHYFRFCSEGRNSTEFDKITEYCKNI